MTLEQAKEFGAIYGVCCNCGADAHERGEHRAGDRPDLPGEVRMIGVKVKREMCATCIFRPGNPMHLRPGRVQSMVEDCEQSDSYITCHETMEEVTGDQDDRGDVPRLSRRRSERTCAADVAHRRGAQPSGGSGVMPGETILSGAPETCPDCGTFVLPFQVLRSGAGSTSGPMCKDGPYSRESGYFPTEEAAATALETNEWEAR